MSLTPEQIKEAISSEDGKKAIEAAVDEAVRGLKNKNDELLNKLKKSKDDNESLDERLKKIEEDKLKAEEEAANKSGDVEKIKEQLEQRHERHMNEANEKIAKLEKQLHTHVVGEGLTKALVNANVKGPLLDAAKALINANYQGEIGDNDGTPFAKFDGKAVDEFVTSWAQTEAGKHFISANANSGGGSNGANGSGQGAGGSDQTEMSRSDYDTLSPAEQSQVMRQGKTVLVD